MYVPGIDETNVCTWNEGTYACTWTQGYTESWYILLSTALGPLSIVLCSFKIEYPY